MSGQLLLGIPKKIGHGYIPVKSLGIEFLQTDFAKEHRRLTVFHHKGTVCANLECGKMGVHVIEAKQKRGNSSHIDVYTKDFELMTVDHIMPKCAGGSEELSNKQPMCQKCNENKGGVIPEGMKMHAVVEN